uniref:Uncharacterized protein n=1 Tax=Terrapene triunguis TaxID=2587831 RepID=A0A674JVJ7_9SAUR
MATYSVANERLRVLEELEREIGASLQSAGRGGASGRGRGLAAEPGPAPRQGATGLRTLPRAPALHAPGPGTNESEGAGPASKSDTWSLPPPPRSRTVRPLPGCARITLSGQAAGLSPPLPRSPPRLPRAPAPALSPP